MVQELCTIGLRASLGQSFEQQSLPSFLPFSKAVQAELKNLEYKLLVKDRCSVDVYTGDLPGFREGATHYGFIRIFNDRRAGVRLKLHADLSKLELLNAWEYREKEIGQ